MYAVELAKQQWSGFHQTHKFKCEQAQRRALLGLSGAEAKECMKDSRQWVGLYAQLFSCWVWPGLGCSFRSLAVCLRLSVRQTWQKWEAPGTLEGVPLRHVRGLRWRSAQTSLERRLERDEWVTMPWLGHSCPPFGSSHLIHSHLYSICFLECTGALRFRAPLFLI